MKAIELEKICKRYNDIVALKDVSLSVKLNEIFGLIGPDGAGKSTLMRIICTLILPDKGRILVLGKEPRKDFKLIRSRIGYMPQNFSLYQDLTVEQNLHFFADLFQVPKSEREKRLRDLYQFSHLYPFKKRKAGALSGGMKQKLALSCALIHSPELLILDEPTYGVDPVSRQEFWRLLHSIREKGTTIFVSTAYMDEADHCDRVAFIHKGLIRMVGTPDELRKKVQFPLFRIEGKNLIKLKDFFEKLDLTRMTQLFGDAIHVSFRVIPEPSDWEKWKAELRDNLVNWEEILPSVEDVFMEVLEEEIQ